MFFNARLGLVAHADFQPHELIFVVMGNVSCYIDLTAQVLYLQRLPIASLSNKISMLYLLGFTITPITVKYFPSEVNLSMNTVSSLSETNHF